MAIKHTMVSYYGLNYVEHAEKDFQEMIDHGVDTVLLAITEFDMDFWFPNLNNIIKTAHDVGLRCIADLWGIGKFFGGRDHTTVLYSLNQVEKKMRVDPAFAETVKEITTNINSKT